MNNNKRKIVLALAAAAAMIIASAGIGLADSGKDHPLIKRYPGSEIGKYFVKDFDEVQMPTGKSEQKGFASSVTVKGKVTGIIYRNPKKRSTGPGTPPSTGSTSTLTRLTSSRSPSRPSGRSPNCLRTGPT